MLQTERLQILPLSVTDLELYLRGENLFELQFGLLATNRTVAQEVKRYVSAITLPCMRKLPDDQFLFFTFWLVIDKTLKKVVAELGFKGVPSPAGMVEIGYGTMQQHRNKGYMSEAVSAVLQWAGTRTEIRTVLAETAKTNNASIRVLQRNGFEQYEERGDMLWWRIVLP